MQSPEFMLGAFFVDFCLKYDIRKKENILLTTNTYNYE